MDILEQEPDEVFGLLFEDAKSKDEFEFICSLMRIRGMEDVGWDPFMESHELAQQLIGLIDAPLDQKLRFRLSLFLYCHLTEMTDLYAVTANLLRILRGDRYVLDPFHDLPKPPKPQTGDLLNRTIRQLANLATEVGRVEVGEFFTAFYMRPIRNAFYHSDYVLTNDSLNIKHGEGIRSGNIISHNVELQWLVPRLNLGINAALALFDAMASHIGAYKQDKIVKGRFAPDGSYVDIQITTDPIHGLRGFREPPDPDFLKSLEDGAV